MLDFIQGGGSGGGLSAADKATIDATEAAVVTQAAQIADLQARLSAPIPDEVPDTAPGDDATGYVLSSAPNATNKATWLSKAALLKPLMDSVASVLARLVVVEAGAPEVFGPSRLYVPAADPLQSQGLYTVLRKATGRAYTFSVVNQSVANAASISNVGLLSTAAGWTALAGGTLVTLTVRATDDATPAKTYDFGVILEKLPAGAVGPFGEIDLGSYELTASNSAFNLAAITPAGTTQILVECVGPGASGFSGRVDNTNNIFVPGHGGAAGGVRRRLIRYADIPTPTSINVQIPAGGAQALTNATYSTSNAGGICKFGSLLQAVGGLGGYHYTTTDLPYPWQLLPPSDVPLGRQGYSNGPLYPYPSGSVPDGMGAHAAPSFGPGSGGAGRNGNTNASGNGGWAGVGRPDTAVPGSYFEGGGGVVRGGSDAPNIYGYGTGGAGAGTYPGANFINSAGAGRNPGGGGGGGAGYYGLSTGSSSYGGAGGNAAIRLFFKKVA